MASVWQYATTAKRSVNLSYPSDMRCQIKYEEKVKERKGRQRDGGKKMKNWLITLS